MSGVGRNSRSAADPRYLAMDEEIAFLLHAAEELRALALTAPEVASELRRTADELEARAAELSRQGRGRYSRGRDRLH